MERFLQTSRSKGRKRISFIAALLLSFLLTACDLNSELQGYFDKGDTLPSEVIIEPEVVEVKPVFPTNGSNWNNYVDSSDNSACDPDTDTECVNGGLNKVVSTSASSCSGFEISDELGLFDWECKVESSKAKFYSKGFKKNKGLLDAVSASGWKSNKIVINKQSTTYFESASSVWWENPVNPLPDNSSGSVIVIDGVDDDGAGPDQVYANGTVFVIDSDIETAGYNIKLDDITIVTTNGAKIKYSGAAANNCNSSDGEVAGADTRCVFSANNIKYFWLEGNISGLPVAGMDAEYLVLLNNSKFNSFHNLNMDTALTAAIRLQSSHNNSFDNVNTSGVNRGLCFNASEMNLVKSSNFITGTDIGIALGSASTKNKFLDISVSHYSNHGIQVSGSDENVFHNIRTSNNANYGVRLQSSDDNSLTHLLSVQNGQEGMRLDSSNYNTITNATFVNNSNHGIKLYPNADFNTLVNVVAANNADKGFYLNAADSNKFSQLSVTDNGGNGIYLTGCGSYNNKFQDNIIVGSNGSGDSANCYDSGGTGNEIDNSCVSATANVLTGSSYLLGADFVNLQVDDALNASDTNGESAFASITYWTNFENKARVWGKQSSNPFPNSDQRGPCVGGNCQIWDYSLKDISSSLIKGTVLDGSTVLGFSSGQACPASVGGEDFALDYQTTASQFLVNATEIIGDEIGDEDGLCESNESCYYNPNFGFFQGDGELDTSSSCVFSDGTVSGVSLYRYQNN